MVKILIEDDDNGNRMKVIEPDDGARKVDILTAVGSPLMSLVLDVCDHDYQKSVDILTELLDAYIETNGDSSKIE